jgi:hypothetical protein
VPIDKNNLTNFQRIFRNEKDITQHVTQTTNGISPTDDQTSSSVFNVIHSVGTDEQIDASKQQETNVHEDYSLKKCSPSAAAIICNPLLLSQPSDDQPNVNAPNNGNCDTSTTSNSLNEGVFNSNMHINRMFGDAHDHVNLFL